MPFRVESVGTVASPNLPARKGILALRHAHPAQAPKFIGGSGLSGYHDEMPPVAVFTLGYVWAGAKRNAPPVGPLVPPGLLSFETPRESAPLRRHLCRAPQTPPTTASTPRPRAGSARRRRRRSRPPS